MENRDVTRLRELANSMNVSQPEREAMTKLIEAAKEQLTTSTEAPTGAKPKAAVKVDEAVVRNFAKSSGKALASTAILSHELRGTAYAMTNTVAAIRDSITDNGDEVLRRMESYLPPAMTDPNLRERVMSQTRENFLKAVAERRYEDALREFDGDLLEGLNDSLAIPTKAGVAAWPAAAAAVVVVATLVHTVYTSVTSSKLAGRFINPVEAPLERFVRPGRFAWF
ncbi:MAG: hypothetical protein EHM23_15980 [Acidobacteria bacterium]|nr:MAG: hypothetical protein EHM23_15980 [Acidobacteriota bacterium]